MQRIIWWLIAIVGAGIFGLIVYNAMRSAESPAVAQPAPPVAPTPSAAPPAEPEIRHPVPGIPGEKPVPALDTSDSTMKSALADLSGHKDLIDVLILQGFVRRVVATIDSLPGPKVASRIMPIRRVDGKFAVSGSEGSYTIAADNAARYAKYVKFAEAVDSRKLAVFYFQYYPLFQQAYRELGYPKGHFNDRLVEVIDHLLAAPQLQDPVALVRPKVFYLYADPELEMCSAGQKILMRMGAEHAGRLKAKLRDIRAAIAAQPALTDKGR
jgi:Protein of unknown function (DUF3014)